MAEQCEHHEGLVKELKDMLKEQHLETKEKIKEAFHNHDMRIKEVERTVKEQDKKQVQYELIANQLIQSIDKLITKVDNYIDSNTKAMTNLTIETARNTENTNDTKAVKAQITKWVVGGILASLALINSIADKISF